MTIASMRQRSLFVCAGFIVAAGLALVAYLTTGYRMNRIVQTPTLIVMADDDGMHREIFMDGRSLEPDPNPTWAFRSDTGEGDVRCSKGSAKTITTAVSLRRRRS
jgi:hypothetical protein